LSLPCSKTLAGANNSWEKPAFGGSYDASTRRFSLGAFYPSATQVAAGAIYFPLDFTPSVFIFQTRITATGVMKIWDGAVLYTPPSAGNPGYVKVDNSGSTDWNTTDGVFYFIAE
jgi:hypothetical protein